MAEQCTSHLLMIRPVSFGFNEEAAKSNSFMINANSDSEAQKDALERFDNFVQKLVEAGIDVIVVNDRTIPKTPDSIFPNNWISFHDDGRVVLYPMEAKNRRLERRDDILKVLDNRFEIGEIINFSSYENEGFFLEGTGSLVLDRTKKVAYACLSSRTSEKVLAEWHKVFPEYKIVTFNASDIDDVPVYHTNVLLCVAEDFSVICSEAIKNEKERVLVLDSLSQSGKEPLLISLNQMTEFAGNMLQVVNNRCDKILIMSTRAYRSLSPDQMEFLLAKSQILTAELGLIETLGGGSARCMLAEIHLPLKS